MDKVLKFRRIFLMFSYDFLCFRLIVNSGRLDANKDIVFIPLIRGTLLSTEVRYLPKMNNTRNRGNSIALSHLK